MSPQEPHPDTPRDSSFRSSATDRRTIARYLDGKPAAVRKLDDWIRTELRSRFPVLRHDADDVAQTVHGKLLEIFRKETFRRDSTLKTFVVMVTRYTAVDRIRALHRRLLLEDSAALLSKVGESPYRRLHDAERRTLLVQVLTMVPTACRDLWILAYEHRLSQTEIARRLSLPVGTVKSRMWACRRRALALLDRLSQSVPRTEDEP